MIRTWKFEKETLSVPDNFDERHAAVIAKVAKGSPAEKIGIVEGDRLISFNGDTVLEQSVLDITASANTCVYQTYQRSEHSILNVEIDPLPIGIVTEPSSDQLVKAFRAGDFPGWEGFRLLWKRRDWDNLQIAADTTYSNTGISHLIRKVFKNFGRNAGMLYTGAALFETGNEQEGIEIISEFIDSVMSDYESAEHAIAFFYLAKWFDLVGKQHELEKWLGESDRSNGGKFERISQEVYLKGLQPAPDRYRWKGKNFPIRYSLKQLEKEQLTSLSETLSVMSDNQLLPLCVMPSYRDNGPYNDAMGCYASIYEYLSDRILPLHIILDTLQSRPGQEWRRENENLAAEKNIPFELLHDPERSVSALLEIEFTPMFYFLNKDGIVVYDGPLNSGYDYWTALER